MKIHLFIYFIFSAAEEILTEIMIVILNHHCTKSKTGHKNFKTNLRSAISKYSHNMQFLFSMVWNEVSDSLFFTFIITFDYRYYLNSNHIIIPKTFFCQIFILPTSNYFCFFSKFLIVGTLAILNYIKYEIRVLNNIQTKNLFLLT